MKKTYKTPKSKLIMFRGNELLAGSRLEVNNNSQNNLSGDSKSDTYSIWDK